MPVIEVRNLSVEFTTEHGKSLAVNNISFTLNANETLGIVGESGSGKSVSALSVMQLIATPPGRITNGQIIFSDDKGSVDLISLPEKSMQEIRGAKIGMIFQEPMTSLNPVHRCGNQITEMITRHKRISYREAKKETIDLFNEVMLPRPKEIFNAYPHQISGGQKQRVMIAMAIACNPSLLIADEPTTALDVTVQKSILQLMKKLQKKYGLAILFISHDLGVIGEIADKAIVMYQGKIVEKNTIENLFKKPEHPYTQGLLACRPPLHKKLKRLPTIGDFMKNDKNNENAKLSIETYLKQFEKVEGDDILKNEKLYEKPPVLSLSNVETHFPYRSGFWGLQKKYVKAVDGITIDIFHEETMGLVGESGCGKTTLGRSIIRLNEPTGGKIKFRGKSITELNKQELRKLRKEVQIIFQDPYSSLNPRLTAGEAITEPMKVYGLYSSSKERKEKAIELLEKVSLGEEHFYRYPHEFSGGQRQRICIARAISVNPSLIICDESVSALDVSIQAQVLNLLNELKEEYGFTYIFISHDLSVVKFMSDRIAVMKDGKIVEMGDAEEVYNNPKDTYTKKLIEAIPAIK